MWPGRPHFTRALKMPSEIPLGCIYELFILCALRALHCTRLYGLATKTWAMGEEDIIEKQFPFYVSPFWLKMPPPCNYWLTSID